MLRTTTTTPSNLRIVPVVPHPNARTETSPNNAGQTEGGNWKRRAKKVATGIAGCVAFTTAALYGGAAISLKLFEVSASLQGAVFERARRAAASAGTDVTWKDADFDARRRLLRLRHVTASRPSGGAVLHADAVDVRLVPLWVMPFRWATGRGIVFSVDASGVVGVIDGRSRSPDAPDQTLTEKTPATAPGSIELSSFQVSDAHLTLFLKDPTIRPVQVFVQKFECDRVRQRWLVHDLLMAKSAVGRFDGNLFVLQKKAGSGGEPEVSFRMDGLNVDLIGATARAPLSWLRQGFVDIASTYRICTIPAPKKAQAAEKGESDAQQVTGPAFAAKFDMVFRNLRCEPKKLLDPSLSLSTNAFVPLLVKHFNRQPHVPLAFDIAIPLKKFDGAQGPSKCGLWDAVTIGMAKAFAKIVPGRTEMISGIFK